tara:strand:- start:1866 stop:2165 length:300 start_codon:yes stop_codon:yes gene_type:complete
MPKTITTRLPDKFVSGIKLIASKENLDVSAVIRKLLANAIPNWKKNYAVEKYKNGDFSLEQASKFSEVSVWDFFDILKQKKVTINYDIEELEADLKSIR